MSDTDKRSRRYIGIGASQRLKKGKVTVEPKSRAKLRDSDITIESPEFQLLVRLYVPAKLLIRNNKVLRRQLAAYLPVIVNENVPNLNFELHIFLSTIVTTYVSSWYLSKLNTDSFDFLASVYGVLCDFVKDFSRRVLLVVELPHVLDLVDDFAHILDTHVQSVELENGTPRMVREYLKRHRNSVCCDMDEAAVIDAVLLESHIIFNKEVPPKECANDNIADHNIGQAETCDPLQRYLRVLTRHILYSTFDSPLIGSGPTSSAIATNFLTIVIADLVLTKVVTALSTPKCFLQISEKVLEQLQKRQSDNVTPLHHRVVSSLKHIYVGMSRVVVALSNHDAVLVTLSIMYSPVLSFVNTVTGFSSRQPVASYVASTLRSLLLSSNFSGRIEGALRTWLASSIRQSPALDDRFLASVVQTVLELVFSQTLDAPPAELTVKSVSTSWFIYLKSIVPVSWFAYRGESEQDMEERIQAFFCIFTGKVQINELALLTPTPFNTLLIVRLLDCVVQYLYPELVQSFSAGQTLTNTTP